jgi:hypothetical protein
LVEEFGKINSYYPLKEKKKYRNRDETGSFIGEYKHFAKMFENMVFVPAVEKN